MRIKKEVLKKLGERIRELREARKLTQAEFANDINKDRQSLQRLELGKINPSFFYLLEVADGLEITLPELLNFSLNNNNKENDPKAKKQKQE